MKKLFYKFLWSIPIILFFFILLQIITHKKRDFKPSGIEKSLIESTGIKINLFKNNKIHTTISAQWAQVQNIPHNDNVVIVCKEDVSYSEHKQHYISAKYAEITLERKDKLDYSLKAENIISVLFKDNVQIKSEKETVTTNEAEYLVRRNLIYGSQTLTVQSTNGYFLQSAKGFNWNLKDNVITFKGTTTGEFLAP